MHHELRLHREGGERRRRETIFAKAVPMLLLHKLIAILNFYTAHMMCISVYTPKK